MTRPVHADIHPTISNCHHDKSQSIETQECEGHKLPALIIPRCKIKKETSAIVHNLNPKVRGKAKWNC